MLSFFKKHNKCPKIHLKFDTGMTRLGFDFEDYNKVFDYIIENSLLIEGIYSCFSTADEGDPTFVETQLERFNTILKSGNAREYLFVLFIAQIVVPYLTIMEKHLTP